MGDTSYDGASSSAFPSRTCKASVLCESSRNPTRASHDQASGTRMTLRRYTCEGTPQSRGHLWDHAVLVPPTCLEALHSRANRLGSLKEMEAKKASKASGQRGQSRAGPEGCSTTGGPSPRQRHARATQRLTALEAAVESGKLAVAPLYHPRA